MEHADVNPTNLTSGGLLARISDWTPVSGPRQDVVRYPVLVGTLRIGPYELRVHRMSDGTVTPVQESVDAIFGEIR